MRKAPCPREDSLGREGPLGGLQCPCCQSFTQVLIFLQEPPSSGVTKPCPKSPAVTQKAAGLLQSRAAAAFGAILRDTGEALVGSQGAASSRGGTTCIIQSSLCRCFSPKETSGIALVFLGQPGSGPQIYDSREA